jgi:iron complex outermembrane receptor protein
MSVAMRGVAMVFLLSSAASSIRAEDAAEPEAAASVDADQRDAESAIGESPSSSPERLSTIPVSSPAATPQVDGDQAPVAQIIEEVIVTAQKREENIQDVPISIQAFSGETLEVKGIHTVADLQQVTSGLQFGSTAGFPIVFLRGVGTDVFLPTEDPSITTYIDGIYIPMSQGVAQGLGGVQRVEVLKGPQGTLFGRNSTGGAISIVTKKPGDAFEGNAQAEMGNYGERRAKAYVSGPITSMLGANADVIYSRIDSAYEAGDGREIPPDKALALRGRVNFHPTDRFDIDVSYLDVDNDGTGTQVAKNIKPGLLGSVLGLRPQKDDRHLESDYIGGYKASHKLLTAAIHQELDWFDVKLSGSDQKIRSYDTSVDFDGTRVPLAVFAGGNVFTESQTLELQFLSNGGWGGQTLEWAMGVYYLESEAGADPGELSLLVNVFEAVGLPQSIVDLLDQLPFPNINDGVPLVLRGRMGTESLSGYAQATWHALDWLSVTLGGRYQTEERTLLKSQTEVGLLIEGQSLPILYFPLGDRSYDNLSPKLTISITPREDWMFYATAARGFKSGTYNVVTLYSPGSYVKPETVTTYDLGIDRKSVV